MLTRLLATALALCGIAGAAGASEVNRCVNADGSAVWTHKPCPGDEARRAPRGGDQCPVRGALMREATDAIPDTELACKRCEIVRKLGEGFVLLRDTDESSIPCHTRADAGR